MNMDDFMRKFLPDYVSRHEEYNPAHFKSFDVEFMEENFPEALQNFANRICEKQRELCAEEFPYNSDPNDLDGYIEHCKSFMEAEQPKIDEI
jgi:hypothetical protein